MHFFVFVFHKLTITNVSYFFVAFATMFFLRYFSLFIHL